MHYKKGRRKCLILPCNSMAFHLSLSELMLIILSAYLIFKPTIAQRSFNGTISQNCQQVCGNITIPYPFGIGIGNNCSFGSTFLIECRDTSLGHKPYLAALDLEVLLITPAVVRVNIPPGGNFSTANADNFLAALDWNIHGTCNQTTSLCNSNSTRCVDRNLTRVLTPLYYCSCEAGYEGNPYLPNGCQDINECPYKCQGSGDTCVNEEGTYRCIKFKNKGRIAGIGIGASLGGIFLLVFLWWLFKAILKLKKARLKKKNFKRNGGLLLKQQMASGEDGTVEKTKLFTAEELEKATDHYNEDRILGQGGQGTVYKGMLTDGRIVAIKMSKMVDEGNLEQFINEVVILSQINHRHVVKLHGCCLETEVPLLVYEFIPNGTLSQYLYNQNDDLPLSWVVRLRIATEVASALSYLHYAASQPIYHRDMKSTNILLDEKYRAKVADFGTSRSIAIEQTHLTTRVLGTFGYLDPEYFQTGQFTEKSDVYSFGVILVELLTGEKPISSNRSEESRSLASYFIVAMEENTLFDIIDARIEKEGGNEEILTFANLAKRCISLDVKRRPTMKEVASGLDEIRMSSTRSSKVELHYEDVEYPKEYFSGPLRKTSSSMFSHVHINASSDIHPLVPKK